MTKREDQMRERIYSLEGQLVKAAIMITEARERAEAAETALSTAREALQWYADNFVVNGSRAAAVLAELEEPHNG